MLLIVFQFSQPVIKQDSAVKSAAAKQINTVIADANNAPDDAAKDAQQSEARAISNNEPPKISWQLNTPDVKENTPRDAATVNALPDAVTVGTLPATVTVNTSAAAVTAPIPPAAVLAMTVRRTDGVEVKPIEVKPIIEDKPNIPLTLYDEPLKLYTVNTYNKKPVTGLKPVQLPALKPMGDAEAAPSRPINIMPDEETPRLYKISSNGNTPAEAVEPSPPLQVTRIVSTGGQNTSAIAEQMGIGEPLKLYKVAAAVKKPQVDPVDAAAYEEMAQLQRADIKANQLPNAGYMSKNKPLKLYALSGKGSDAAETVVNSPAQGLKQSAGDAGTTVVTGKKPPGYGPQIDTDIESESSMIGKNQDSMDIPKEPENNDTVENTDLKDTKTKPFRIMFFGKLRKSRPSLAKEADSGPASEHKPVKRRFKVSFRRPPKAEKQPAAKNTDNKVPQNKPRAKTKTAVNKYDKRVDNLRPQVEIIGAKAKGNAHYIMTKRERGLMKRWNLLLLSQRQEDIKIGKRRISKKNTKIKRRRRATVVPRTTQQSIPYITDYEEGLFEVEPNKYSKTYMMQDLNYLLAQVEEQRHIFEKYGEFLNYFSDDMNVAITIDNHVVSLAEQERSIFYPDRDDEYDLHRHEYNGILRRQILAGRNDIKITKYVTVTIDCDTPYEALLRFHKIDAEVITNLRRIGADGRMLSTEERLAVLHDKFRKGHEGEFEVSFDFLKEQGVSSKDYIAPSFFRFERSHFMIDEQFYRCLYVSNLPNSLTDTFLSELVDVEFPLVTTINVQPLAQDKALRLIRKQLTGMESNKIESEKRAVRSGYSPETISHDLKQSLAQAETLLNEVQSNDQKMFFVTITLMAAGDTLEELDEHCKVLESRARQKTCQLQSFIYQQENAFRCTLPVGMAPYNKIYVERALTTTATAVFIPFSSQELFQLGGFYYGLNQMSRNLILCDRTAMKTPSGFILGSTGSGKSFATKREQMNVILQDPLTTVLVIDPENEYGDFARAFGGVRINISMESSNYVNPMDMSFAYGLDDEDDIDIENRKTKALQKKSDVIMSIVQSMIANGKNETLITPQQKTIVDRAVRRTYTDYLAHNFDPAYLPTLLDLQGELDKERNTKEGQELADGVEYYTKGSMNVFAHQTNVNYSGRFVVFNVKELGEQLKQIALLIILDFIWNRLMSNFSAHVRTYCYVDEIHLLFKNEYSSRFLQQLYKRGRKYGLVMTGITQNMTDVLATEMSRSMIANSDFLMLLSQSPEDLKILAEMLNISEAQMAYVNRAEPGSGLLFAEKVIVPFVDQFPSTSYLYKLMSTKFNEEYTTETVEDILNEAQQQKEKDRRYSLHNSHVRQIANDLK